MRRCAAFPRTAALRAIALLDVDGADILVHAARHDSFIALNLHHDF